MKRKIYLSILALFTVCCIIFGSIYHLAPMASNGFLSFIPIFSKSGSQTAGPLENSSAISLDAFSKIDIETNVASITLCSGEDYSIQYRANEKLIPTYEISNSVLTLKQNPHIRNFNFGNTKCTITITVPENTDLNTIAINNDVGDITICGIKADTLTTDSDVGDQSIDQCELHKLQVNSSVGDTDIRNTCFTSLVVDGDIGDIDIHSRNDLSNYEMDLSTEVGSVTMNGKSCKHGFVQNGNQGDISVDNSTGDVSLSY